MTRTLLVVAVMVSAFVVNPASIWSQSIDPQSLIGSWDGAWQWRNQQHGGGQYHLTIDRVQGNTIFGSVHVSGRWTKEFKVVGTVDGNRLTYDYGSEMHTDLQIVDNSRMQGTTTGALNRTVILTKRK
jgi:hypothetical protein